MKEEKVKIRYGTEEYYKRRNRRKKQVRVVYKITDTSKGMYYIGKDMFNNVDEIYNFYYKLHNDVGTKENNPTYNGKLGSYIVNCDFSNLKFEILEYNIEHIFMIDVLKKYLSAETDPNKLMYYEQRNFVINNLRG
ncbi:MAG: hypothetical protein ACRC3Y_14650 [Romboutsia sp.]|uniref:hypothetical protein n=1 Tax=Romboutsia sp. TaxID=1965302 RepID=UPI003F34F184